MLRTVLQAAGPSRLARLSGVLRRGRAEDAALILESNETGTPVIILAAHQLNVNGALVADIEGNPLIRDGDRVEVVGGFPPRTDPRHPAFLAARVAIVEG